MLNCVLQVSYFFFDFLLFWTKSIMGLALIEWQFFPMLGFKAFIQHFYCLCQHIVCKYVSNYFPFDSVNLGLDLNDFIKENSTWLFPYNRFEFQLWVTLCQIEGLVDLINCCPYLCSRKSVICGHLYWRYKCSSKDESWQPRRQKEGYFLFSPSFGSYFLTIMLLSVSWFPDFIKDLDG